MVNSISLRKPAKPAARRRSRWRDIAKAGLALSPLLAMDTEPCETVIEHVEKVANLAGAEEETVRLIYNGMIAFLGEVISRVKAKAKELERQQAPH